MTETAFCHLKGRWRCLLERNDTDLKYVMHQVAACYILHNVCEINGIALMTGGKWHIQKTPGQHQE